MTSDLIRISEASALIGFDRAYINDWARRGLLERKLVKTDNQLRGFLYVSREEVVRVADGFRKNGHLDRLTVPEAAELVDRDNVNVYRWIRLGYLKAVKLRGPRSKDGNLYVDRKELLEVAERIYQGVRSDIDVKHTPPPKRERDLSKVKEASNRI